ncbi:unnamed protein product [Caenorhabditis angaria]|uniref:Uncharacterized protein n=1 Tax=Caenorhabditis angaria TaxID=860376 RepID=A0A9P1J0G1_9PELO|nr:unnamed protein product [Caenorhabditis angaria]
MDLDNHMPLHNDSSEVCPCPDPPSDAYSNQAQGGPRQNISSGSQKIDMWRNRNFDSGFQTMNHSEAPSIISSLHPSSHISGMSSVADYEQLPSLSDHQKLKFDGISYGSTESQYGSAVRAIPELTNLMKDLDHAVVYKAVYIMQNIAKMDSDQMRRQKQTVITDVRVIIALRDVLRDKVEHMNIIRVALGTLFHICNRPEGLDLIAHAISMQPDFIQYLVQHITSVQFSCYKYALLTLHSILSDKHRGGPSLNLARQCDALKNVVGWLETEKSEKLLPVIVDLVRILCDKQNEQRTIFLKLGGSQKLLHIIQTCNYENLLWRCTQLLKTFSNFDANNLVLYGAREILSRMLAHESQRLIISTLETLRNISDVPSQYKEDAILKSLIMLLGIRHPTVMLYTVQILSNLVANNKHNKEFLVCNNTIEMLLRSLMEASAFMPGLSREAHIMEEFMESVICILRQLCVGHSFADKVQAVVFKDPVIFLEKLISMRPTILKQTLNLLLKLASHNALLLTFRDARAGMTCFIEQIVHIWKVSCNQISSQEQIEGVKVKDLIHMSVELLRILSRQQDILEQIIYFLRIPENNRIGDTHTLLPLFVLQKVNLDENTRKSAMLLLYNLMLHEQMATVLENNQAFINLMQQLQVCQTSPELASIADNILKMLFEKKERSMFAKYSATSSTMERNNSLMKDDSMEVGGNEMFDGAGEEWSQQPDPFAELYCGSNAEPSKPFNSPTYNSPTSSYPDYHAPPDYYYHQHHSSGQPSSSSTPQNRRHYYDQSHNYTDYRNPRF